MQPGRSDDEPVAVGGDDEAEARMRQALGLFGQRPSPAESGGGRQGGGHAGGGHMQIGARRHRFVQDGEVPVSVVRGRRDQVGSALAPVQRAETRDRLIDEQMAERSGREQAERRLAEAQAAIRTLQTRLGHAELERDEAVGEARSLREQLQAERLAVEELRAQQAAAETAGARGTAPVEPEASVAEVEPQPVKWWL